MRSAIIGLSCLASLAAAVPSFAADARVFSAEEVRRNEAEITGKPPRMARLPDERDRATVEGSIAPRGRKLIILRTAWLCQSPLGWGKHVALSKEEGLLTSEEIERITQGSSAPGWSAHDRAILKAVEELHETSMIGDPSWAALSEALSEPQRIEMTMIIGHVQGGSYLTNALRTPLPAGNAGLSAR